MSLASSAISSVIERALPVIAGKRWRQGEKRKSRQLARLE